MEIYFKDGLNAVVEEIKKFEKDILFKLGLLESYENTIFDKYNVFISEEKKSKLHFTKNGIISARMIFLL